MQKKQNEWLYTGMIMAFKVIIFILVRIKSPVHDISVNYVKLNVDKKRVVMLLRI